MEKQGIMKNEGAKKDCPPISSIYFQKLLPILTQHENLWLMTLTPQVKFVNP